MENKEIDQRRTIIVPQEYFDGTVHPSIVSNDWQGKYVARINREYIDELQAKWDDEFDIQAGPLAALIDGIRGTGMRVQGGDGLIAVITKRTYVSLGMRD